MDFRVTQTQLCCPAIVHTSCMTLGEGLKLSGLSFLINKVVTIVSVIACDCCGQRVRI